MKCKNCDTELDDDNELCESCKLPESSSGGLSLNTIIISALALLVLVILILIFSGKLGNLVNEDVTTPEEYCEVRDMMAIEDGSKDTFICFDPNDGEEYHVGYSVLKYPAEFDLKQGDVNG